MDLHLTNFSDAMYSWAKWIYRSTKFSEFETAAIG